MNTAIVDAQHSYSPVSTLARYPSLSHALSDEQARSAFISILPHQEPSADDPILQIGIPDFELVLGIRLLELRNNYDYSEVTIVGAVTRGVTATLVLTNEPNANVLEPIHIRKASLTFDVHDHSARSFFFSESLLATVSLARCVRLSMSTINLNIELQLTRPLQVISKMMERRQTYFGLLVIERSTGLEFEIPEFITSEDMNAIAFIYHAIVRRRFEWICNEVGYSLPANEETFSWAMGLRTVDRDDTMYKMQFGPDETTKAVFGKAINLGDQTVLIDDAILAERETILRELALEDGHVVRVNFRPLSRRAIYFLPNAPILPTKPWDLLELNLIKLEDQLDAQLISQYNDEAATDLTSEEFMALAERPTLDDEPDPHSG